MTSETKGKLLSLFFSLLSTNLVDNSSIWTYYNHPRACIHFTTVAGDANSLAHVGKMARAPMGGTGGMAPAVGTVVAMLKVTSWQLGWPREVLQL